MSAAFAIAGAVIYTKTFASTGGLSFTKVAVACGVGALCALLGCAVGWVIDRARR